MESSTVRVDPDDHLLASSDSEDEDDNILPKMNVTYDSAGINIYFCKSYFNSTMGGHNLWVLLAMSEGIMPYVALIPRH